MNIYVFDVMAAWMNMPLMAHRYIVDAPECAGSQHSFIAPYGTLTYKGEKQALW